MLRRIAIEEDEDLNAAAGSPEKGGGYESAGFIAVEDIGLEMNRSRRPVYQFYQRIEIVFASVDQADLIVMRVSGK